MTAMRAVGRPGVVGMIFGLVLIVSENWLEPDRSWLLLAQVDIADPALIAGLHAIAEQLQRRIEAHLVDRGAGRNVGDLGLLCDRAVADGDQADAELARSGSEVSA